MLSYSKSMISLALRDRLEYVRQRAKSKCKEDPYETEMR